MAECPIEKFERMAEHFYLKYGYLAPGKDSRTERPVSDKVLMEQWRDFVKRYHDSGEAK